jgi:hypothetical protein
MWICGVNIPCTSIIVLKGHGNEADFLGFLQKLAPHRSLTLPFEPFRFWLRICGDIRNGKTILERRFLNVKRKLGELESRLLPNSASQRVGESLFKFFKIYYHFNRLNQPN